MTSGRQAAIILMINEIHADAAVEALNRHVDYTGELLSAEKQTVVPLPEKLDTDDDPLPTMSEMGALREKSTPSPTSVLTNNISNNNISNNISNNMCTCTCPCTCWSVLCEDADEDADEEVHTNTMVNSKTLKTPKPVDNTVVTGIWADMDRKNTMLHKLIFED